MKTLWLIACLLFGACSAQVPQQPLSLPEDMELPAYGDDEDIVKHLGYTASYNHSTLCPNWVAWALTAEEANGKVEGQYSFSRDPDVAFPKASREDYSRSGWDKGHMAPRADMKWSAKAMEESYYFTNICPQDHEMNSHAWRKIEELTRRLAQRYGTVYVVCGPFYTDQRHGAIGNVLVPDIFFKALAINTDKGVQTVGFLVENTPQSFAPRHYAVCVDSVEAMIGRDLFPLCDEAAEEDFDWEVWNY